MTPLGTVLQAVFGAMVRPGFDRDLQKVLGDLPMFGQLAGDLLRQIVHAFVMDRQRVDEMAQRPRQRQRIARRGGGHEGPRLLLQGGEMTV